MLLGGGFRPLLGNTNQSSLTLAGFQTFNASINPRSLDVIMFYQSMVTNPIFYGGYLSDATTLGAIMMSSWQPTGTLNSFAGGSNDTYLQTEASRIAAAGVPVIVRMAWEFNGDWMPYGNGHETAAQFVAGWQHVVSVMRTAGATNALFMWCPNVWTDSNEVDPTVADGSGVNWYPGDAYVDLIGLDGYMNTTGPVRTPSILFLSYYTALCAISTKPFGIGECGCAVDARLTGVGGVPTRAQWFAQLFALAKAQMPRCVCIGVWTRTGSPDDYALGTDTTAFAVAVQGTPIPLANL